MSKFKRFDELVTRLEADPIKRVELEKARQWVRETFYGKVKMKKVKVKFEGADALVSLPYKNGYVTWKTDWNSQQTFRWIMFNKPEHYQPDRVGACHSQRLNGKKLRAQILRSTAAAHIWWLMKRFKGAFAYQDRMRAPRVISE